MALHEIRRQQFLSEGLYEEMTSFIAGCIEVDTRELEHDKERPTRNPLGYDSLTSDFWHQWMLEYTAGKPIEELAPQFVKVVDAFEANHKAYSAYLFELGKEPDTFEINPDFSVECTPIDTDVPCEYSEFLQLIGTAILLRDEVSAQRLLQWSESNVNYDGLLDQFYLRYLDDVDPVGELSHPKTFDPLFDTFFADTPEEAQSLLKKFMKGWYKFQKQAPWYDGHLGSSPYFGYWSFEAGAVAFLLDIDDSDIDHMAYPHDLVAYARKLRAENRFTSPRQELKQLKLRVVAGETCPKDGWWWSPAAGKTGSQPFKTGDILPKLESDWGETIWYWHGLTAQG